MNINILVLGKSGAGKSTLLNYLYGQNVAKTGFGRPVTPKRNNQGDLGIFRHDPVYVNGELLTIYDSWGLEADKAGEWLETVMPVLEKLESSTDINDWFHAIIYCVGASGARLEPFETQEIVGPLCRAGHRVVFALTKADRANPGELRALRQAIAEDCPGIGGIVEVESLDTTLRNGKITRAHGKEELIGVMMENLNQKLKTRLVAKYMAQCIESCQTWKDETLRLYDKESGLFTSAAATRKKVEPFANKFIHDRLQSLGDWLDQTVHQSELFMRAFGASLNADLTSEAFKLDVRITIGKAKFHRGDYMAVGLLWFNPLLFLIYLTVRKVRNKDLMKTALAKKLDEASRRIIALAQSQFTHRLGIEG